MDISPEIRERACRMIVSRISPGAREVAYGVKVFKNLPPGTFTHSAIEVVAELLVEREMTATK